MKSILFISRKFPPVVGGMENYAFNMRQQFIKKYHVYEIILNKSQVHLLWFYPWVFLYGSYLLLFKKINVVYVGDGVLSSVAWFFQKFFKTKTVLTIHGLDVIFDKYGYQRMIKCFLPKIQCIVANSQATKSAALDRGVTSDQCHLIPVGIDVNNEADLDKNKARQIVANEIGISLEEKKILFTIGRLVKRKGVYWFIDKVFNHLSKEHIYLIAGAGNDEHRVRALIDEKGLKNRVFLLGKVNDDYKQKLFTSADVFLSPNITIPNDMEGFGIVNLEAGLYGMPVVASRVEGVKDAVIPNITGYLVDEGDVTAMCGAIRQSAQLKPKEIKSYVVSHFSWEAVFERYEKYFN